MHADLDVSLAGQAIGKRTYRERVVEIFCVNRVDGAGADVPEVNTRVASGDPRHRLLGEHLSPVLFEIFRIGDDARREVARETLSQGERAHLDVVHAGLADNLFDGAERVFFIGVPAREAHDDFIAERRIAPIQYDNGDVHLLIIWRDEREPIFFDERTDKRFPRAADDLDDL